MSNHTILLEVDSEWSPRAFVKAQKKLRPNNTGLKGPDEAGCRQKTLS
jgi:hypothetical protein